MLYLITGVPGSGKTLHMMSMLAKRKDLQNRPLYLDGIPDVDPQKIPHKPIPEGHDVKDWYDWMEPGSILVIDECQRWFRPRHNGSAVPRHVSELQTHHHKGVDIFLLTQHPRLVDTKVKASVGSHEHISKTKLGTRRIWEWHFCASPDSKSDINEAIVKPYRLDKSAFGLYKSAEVHTKIKTSRSKWLWLFPAVILFTVGMAYYAYSLFNKQFQPEAETAPVAASAASPAQGGESAPALPTPDAGQIAPQPLAEPVKVLKSEDFIPSLDGKPWTAPVYAPHNTQIATMPYPVACVQTGNKCTCYTDQATPIRDMDKGLCLDFVQNGIYNPYITAQSAAPAPAGSD